MLQEQGLYDHGIRRVTFVVQNKVIFYTSFICVLISELNSQEASEKNPLHTSVSALILTL